VACRSIAEPNDRLACFDRETAALSAGTEAAAKAPGAPASAAPALTAQQRFGLSEGAIEAKQAASARPLKDAKLEAHVVGLSLAGDGRTIFTLDNSQVWRQLESAGDMLAKLGDAVTISRGLLGSYWLQLKSGRGCKVTRLH
jgi:hypothetical protein